MRILLDAYFDSNFGDDLFISTLLGRYPQARFYVFWNKTNPEVLARAMEYPNLTILPSPCELQSRMPFDGYIMIGGDVLPDGIDYTWRIDGMRRVKESGGFVAMLGFSLYTSYGEKTRGDLAAMAALADSIVARDRYSAERFRMLVPGAKVTESTDMAFAGNHRAEPSNREILGISARRKLYSTDLEHADYCAALAAVADGWLEKHPKGLVRFLALSTGEYDDRVTSEEIRARMAGKDRTEITAHTEGVEKFLAGVGECSAMLTTRFHAMVFALIYHIPFVPVPYEAKLTQLLDELGYEGVRIPYGEAVPGEVIARAVAELDRDQVDPEALAQYQSKAELFFADTDRLMQRECCERDFSGFGCGKFAENQALKLENAQLKRDKEYLDNQVKELTAWVEALQQQRRAFEIQNLELEALRINHLGRIESLEKKEAELAQIYKKFPLAKKFVK